MVHFWLDPTYDIEVSEEEIQEYLRKLKEDEEREEEEGIQIYAGGGW